MTALQAFDLECVDDPESDKRVWALTAGLRHLGLAGEGSMLVVTCRDHEDDRAVAVSSATRAGLQVRRLDPTSNELSAALAARPSVVLACFEGSCEVAATRVPCRIFGDRPGMPWWRMLELAHWPPADIAEQSAASMAGKQRMHRELTCAGGAS